MRLFDIKRFAINDGPGIRLTLFLKGCPLHCVWCHNPEGISPHPQLLYNSKKCIGCQTCVELCPQHALTLTQQGIQADDTHCLHCHTCSDACPTLALETAGREWTLDEVLGEVEKERLAIQTSGGGVTLCGGEPLMQPEATLSLLRELQRQGIHTALDTTLYCSSSTLQSILPHCNLLLVDLKHMDSTLHKQYTGVDNQPILSNLHVVSQAAIPYWIRIPLIAGINADEANLQATARFLTSLPTPPQQINLLLYHDIGKGKHDRLRTTYNPLSIPMNTPTSEQQDAALRIFRDAGFNVKIGG